jgi:hypothetical protein
VVDAGGTVSALFGPKASRDAGTWRLGPTFRTTFDQDGAGHLSLAATFALIGKGQDIPASVDASVGPVLAVKGGQVDFGLATRFSFGTFGFADSVWKLVSLRVYSELRAYFDRPVAEVVCGIELNPIGAGLGLAYLIFKAVGTPPVR